MDTERKLCITMIDKFLSKKLSKPIEQCLFEYANDTKHRYMTKLKYITYPLLYPLGTKWSVGTPRWNCLGSGPFLG